jgi:hypothetical protein
MSICSSDEKELSFVSKFFWGIVGELTARGGIARNGSRKESVNKREVGLNKK